MESSGNDHNRVELGEVSGVFGVQGWVKVYSHTRPREQILDYPVWLLESRGKKMSRRLLAGRKQSRTLVAKLEGCDTREDAESLVGAVVAVDASQLPELDAEEYFWRDLIGLSVKTIDGNSLGVVAGLLETGANDVLDVEGERRHLIPFTHDAVNKIDLEAGALIVDWDPDF